MASISTFVQLAEVYWDAYRFNRYCKYYEIAENYKDKYEKIYSEVNLSGYFDKLQ